MHKISEQSNEQIMKFLYFCIFGPNNAKYQKNTYTHFLMAAIRETLTH